MHGNNDYDDNKCEEEYSRGKINNLKKLIPLFVYMKLYKNWMGQQYMITKIK